MPIAREQWLGSGVIVAAFAIGGTAAARTPPPDYGYQWATITHPGNRHVNAQEGPNFHPPYSGPNLRIGRVDYIYRIATTEVTTGQYLEFVNARRITRDLPKTSTSPAVSSVRLRLDRYRRPTGWIHNTRTSRRT